MRSLVTVLLFTAGSLYAAALPGFRVQMLGATSGFASSVAVDSHDTIYYSTTAGDLFRFVDGQSTLVAHVSTVPDGNSGLLGMAMRDDQTAIVHYTTPGQTADVISAIDLRSGTETILHSFVCDIDMPSRPCPVEHHGGNPSVASDGSIFVGIGDYNGGAIAAFPQWNGGKVFRIFPDGSVEQFARGFRNPFDMAWDAAHQRLIVPDNGDAVDDEINIVHQGDFCGWPFTMGDGTAVAGAVAPVYTFPEVVAPTGLVALSGHNPYLRRGYLLATFVGRSLEYIPDVDATPFPAPTPVIQDETPSIIDVAEEPDGGIVFVTGNAIYRLIVPPLRTRAVSPVH